MLGKILKVFGDSNEKQLDRYKWVVEGVNAREGKLAALSDEQLAAKTAKFRERIAEGAALDDLLPKAFAVVREAARRAIGLRHFDVQLIGGAALHGGKVAEMKTGEGKTLVATLPTYLNALTGRGVHVVTVNDYLARRDALWMGKVYTFLGLSVGCLQHEAAYVVEPPPEDGAQPALRPVARKDAYAADITYGTNNEFGFDYLRDSMATDLAQKVQRPLAYAIVDEVDNILIDEARTPLIISGPGEEPSPRYRVVAQVIRGLRWQEGEDEETKKRYFYLSNGQPAAEKLEKERQINLEGPGMEEIAKGLKIDIGDLYEEDSEWAHFIENGLRAQFVYQRDKDYVVKDGLVVIVDEFTGRLMPGRRYGEGMHQAIEAKENVKVQRGSFTYATITIQNYFRMYEKLAGMTGTAMTEAEEFYKVYGLDVVAVPTHKPMVRQDSPDFMFKTHAAKLRAVVDHIAELHEEGRPVLVGTASVEQSEQLSGLLRRRGVKHEVLNAKNHEREAQIIAEAGKPGAVTVSTNMAGRGTDIILGGDPSTAASDEEWRQAHDTVVAKGGLYVLGAERHESRRIDNQLRGRSGRQGDPGETRFFSSFEDEILARFYNNTMGRLAAKGFDDDAPVESGMLARTFDMTQGKAESHYFDIRKHLLEYDDVVKQQRETVYADRDKVLEGADLKSNIQEMIGKEVAGAVRRALVGPADEWEPEPLLAELNTILPLPPYLDAVFVRENGVDAVEEELLDAAEELYERREQDYGAGLMRVIERAVMLQTIDRLWVRHLTTMSDLRQSIGLQAYAQRDPLVMYKMKGHEEFDRLLKQIQHDVVHTIYHVAPANQPAAAANGQTARLNAGKMETVMSKVAAPQRAPAPAPAPVDPNAPRWMRRQAERAAGGGKKAKKRKAGR